MPKSFLVEDSSVGKCSLLSRFPHDLAVYISERRNKQENHMRAGDAGKPDAQGLYKYRHVRPQWPARKHASVGTVAATFFVACILSL